LFHYLILNYLQPLHQRNHPVTRMDKRYLLGSITFVFILMYAYLPFPDRIIQPFPFHGQELYWQTFADYAFMRISILILIGIITYLQPKHMEYLFVFWLLWFGYLIDYFLVFNQPFGWWHFIPLSYSLFAGLSMICLTFIQWKKKL